MRDAGVPHGFSGAVRADRPLVRAWRAFVGNDAMWECLCSGAPTADASTAASLVGALRDVGSVPADPPDEARARRTAITIAVAAARWCDTQAAAAAAGDGGVSTAQWAALFDACVVLLCTHLSEPQCATFTALLEARSPHAAQFPPTRVDECPVDTVWLFRDAFLMGPMRSGGSAVLSQRASAAQQAAAEATRGTKDDDDDPATAAAAGVNDDDDADDDAAVPPVAPSAAAAAARDGGAGEDAEQRRPCEHLPVSIPPAVYARHDRQDAVFTLLHKGWPHKLQPHETHNVVTALLSTTAGGSGGGGGSGGILTGHTNRVYARRTPAAAVALCRWWAYARLGRWPGDEPMRDWPARVALVAETDHRLAQFDPGRGVAMPPSDRASWRVRILGTDARTEARRARFVAGATLSIQAVVIESVRRLAPLRQYLVNHSRWADFERASVAARRAWCALPNGAMPVPAFFSELMAMAPRDTDPNMWLVYVGRCLRSRDIAAVPLPPAVDRSFRIGIAAIPELMRLAWPLVNVARAAKRPPGMTAHAALEVQYYVGRVTATGAQRPEWDPRVPAITVCNALALAEVIRAALEGCGVDATGCVTVFKAIRDLYVCTTGPRVQATALVHTLMEYDPRIARVLVALHNVCVDHLVLRSTPLDAHTTALQLAARARRVGSFSGGRDDWLLVCHYCRRPHTLVSEFDARPVPGTALSSENSARLVAVAAKRARTSLSDHGFRKVAVDVRGGMTFMCNQRQDGARELVYPFALTGRIVWSNMRLYTICPQCGSAMQLNPQLCAYVNFTFACANCTALIADMRANNAAMATAAAPADASASKPRAALAVTRRVRLPPPAGAARPRAQT